MSMLLDYLSDGWCETGGGLPSVSSLLIRSVEGRGKKRNEAYHDELLIDAFDDHIA